MSLKYTTSDEDRAIGSIQQDVGPLVGVIERLDGDLDEARDNVQTLESEVSDLKDEIANLKKQLDGYTT